jgi:putative component of toxin-antitoxin plasmid stabilization module
MLDVRQTTEFSHWFEGLRDAQAKRRIAARIVRSPPGFSVT